MTAIALLRFRQGANIGAGGHALVVAISGTAVTIENTSNIDVASYRIELLYAPPDSTTYPITPGVSAPIELAVGNGVPTATLNVSEAGIYGCYRIRLTVWPLLNQGGVPDVDIRNIAVVTPGFGIILPPYQKFPDPLPLEGAGSKLDELNFAGQARGWAGPAYHAVTYPWRLLHSALKSLIPAAPVSVGAANAEGSATTIARSDHVHAHGDQAGGTLHAGGTELSAGFITPAQVTMINNAFNASDLPQWRDVLKVDYGALGDLGPFTTNTPTSIGGVTYDVQGLTVASTHNRRTFDIKSGVGLRWIFQSEGPYIAEMGCGWSLNSNRAPQLRVPLTTLDPRITLTTRVRLTLHMGPISDMQYTAYNAYCMLFAGLINRYADTYAASYGHYCEYERRAGPPVAEYNKRAVIKYNYSRANGSPSTGADYVKPYKSIAIDAANGLLSDRQLFSIGNPGSEAPWPTMYQFSTMVEGNNFVEEAAMGTIFDVNNWYLELSCYIGTNGITVGPHYLPIRAIHVEAFC